MTPEEFARIERNLEVLRIGLAHPALDRLPQYVEVLEKMAAASRPLERLGQIHDAIRGGIAAKLDFADLILSARNAAKRVIR